ncbi:hypothetical protein GCM10023205_28680 [Yinghuangia aomiensis]|uniref:Uncharacterized protein n=1 Tax=Yinghuangia aomiensis TaxID=676205 RepID=A0ABP9H7I4_9ACTN
MASPDPPSTTTTSAAVPAWARRLRRHASNVRPELRVGTTNETSDTATAFFRLLLLLPMDAHPARRARPARGPGHAA